MIKTNLKEYCNASIEIKENGGFEKFKKNIYNKGLGNGIIIGIGCTAIAISSLDDYLELGIKEKLKNKYLELKNKIIILIK